MTDRRRRSRLWLEGIVIVVSILLAFGIEAGWAELGEAREARRLLESIRDDVLATEAVDRRHQRRVNTRFGSPRRRDGGIAGPPRMSGSPSTCDSPPEGPSTLARGGS